MARIPDNVEEEEDESFCKKHFQLRHVTLYHDKPIVFVISQWQHNKNIPNVKYLIYKAVQAIYLTVTFALSFSDIFFHYLTNWGYTTLAVESWIGFIMLLVCVMGTNCRRNHHWQFYALKCHSFYWLIHVTATSVGFVISLSYWIIFAIYAGDTNYAVAGTDLYVHAFNSVVLFIDLCVVYHPVKLMHFIYPGLFGVAYCIFSVIFYFYDTKRGGKGYVYPILNWAKPAVATPVTIVMFILLIAAHFLTYFLHRIRIHVHHRVINKSYNMSPANSPTDDEQDY